MWGFARSLICNAFLKQKVPQSYSSADESALSYTEFGMTTFLKVNAQAGLMSVGMTTIF